MAVVQGTTAIMYRVLNNNSANNSVNKLKFICFSANSENSGINNLSDYPLNLLFDYNKFISNNKFGKILNFIINRYLKI
jgi:hypothetical protein